MTRMSQRKANRILGAGQRRAKNARLALAQNTTDGIRASVSYVYEAVIIALPATLIQVWGEVMSPMTMLAELNVSTIQLLKV